MESGELMGEMAVIRRWKGVGRSTGEGEEWEMHVDSEKAQQDAVDLKLGWQVKLVILERRVANNLAMRLSVNNIRMYVPYVGYVKMYVCTGTTTHSPRAGPSFHVAVP